MSSWQSDLKVYTMRLRSSIEKGKVFLDEKKVILNEKLDQLQSILEFQGWENSQFQGNGLGKIGCAGFVLGLIFGFHFALFIICMFLRLFYDSSWLNCNIIWGLYSCFLAAFHFLEFLVTAIRHPDNVSYDSFIISHSKSYTFAASTLSIVIIPLLSPFKTYNSSFFLSCSFVFC